MGDAPDTGAKQSPDAIAALAPRVRSPTPPPPATSSATTRPTVQRPRATLETVAAADLNAALDNAVDTLARVVDRLESDAAAAYPDSRDAAGDLYALDDVDALENRAEDRPPA